MGGVLGPEQSMRVRSKLTTFKQLMDDVRKANEEFTPVFVHPKSKKWVRFHVYSRLALNSVQSFWRFPGNTIVVAEVISQESRKLKSSLFVLNPNKFYYMFLHMEDNLAALSKVTKQGNPPKLVRGAGKVRQVRHNTSTYTRIISVKDVKDDTRGRNRCFSTPLSVNLESDRKITRKCSKGKLKEDTKKPPTDTKESGKPELEHIVSSELCSICLDEPSDIVLDCLHAFCESCISEWNVKSSTCPVCRKDIDVGGIENWVLTYSVEKEFLEMAEQLVDFVFTYIEKCPPTEDIVSKGR
uniref:RING finger protein 141 n=1 Tax=Lotharella globosa TaxID=91324 RepID=A0A7S3YFB2_9EUKA|mmetsp:Transcript_20538/g.39609  ORF Transcript_20538/g.39609 Transcript_20538/m.39609 type:complete len:298 (+) Transcript_20538:54-947(+)|eukprot:CAMPEP_0167789988 /NCGR_PEP_ID=MMETSP0111_2-20121227/11036_1 /TAXON_ID=91324 /ORGANISM="Lotharella globosa, Strain CCCM811" /LENGTH=297 /DNA_ID=CAMNT_0007682307 /DNA_START=53 /DNA_END=946 /DNA_ORIENTATION=-